MPLTIWNYLLSYMEFCLVINLTMCGSSAGNLAVTWPPMIATGYASFDTTLNTR